MLIYINPPDHLIKVARVGAMPTHVRVVHPKEADYDQSGRWCQKVVSQTNNGPRESPSHSMGLIIF